MLLWEMWRVERTPSPLCLFPAFGTKAEAPCRRAEMTEEQRRGYDARARHRGRRGLPLLPRTRLRSVVRARPLRALRLRARVHGRDNQDWQQTCKVSVRRGRLVRALVQPRPQGSRCRIENRPCGEKTRRRGVRTSQIAGGRLPGSGICCLKPPSSSS